MSAFTIHRYSEKSLLVSFGGMPLSDAYSHVQFLYESLSLRLDLKPVNIVPAYDSIMVSLESNQEINRLQAELMQVLDTAKVDKGTSNNTEIIIPVCYDDVLGNDLNKMSESIGLDVQSIIELHTKTAYSVYMLGFLPGFAYMGEVSERIAVPRKERPVQTKAGAVGIAGRQTGIYPFNSPGGWQIVGYTPLTMFDPIREKPAFLQPGDRVRFQAIGVQELHHLEKQFEKGNHTKIL